MRIPRVLIRDELSPGKQLSLPSDAAHHLRRVLRLKDDHPLRIFDGQGLECHARLLAGDWVALSDVIDHQAESPLSITLVQGLSRGQKMDYALQKAVELGVSAIQPAFCERSVVRLDNKRLEKRLTHWQGVIESACAQSGRNHVPELIPPVNLTALQAPDSAEGVYLDPCAERGLAALSPSRRLTLVIGPEGGLSDREIRHLQDRAYQGVRLGPRVLRTETASVAALSAIQTLWGDLSD